MNASQPKVYTADTLTDEQIRDLRSERYVRKHGGNATLGKVYQHFPPLIWERTTSGIYRGSRRGWSSEYKIIRRGHYGWRVYRYTGPGSGDHLASFGTYKAAKQWTQLLADGEIKATPEWQAARAYCAGILNARNGAKT